MKNLLVLKKLSLQLIAAIVVSFLVSLGSMSMFIYLVSNLVAHLINKGTNINEFLFYSALALVFITPIIIFIFTFLFLVRKKIAYIKYISEQVNKITKDDSGITLEVIGNDELAELCENINYMSMEIKEIFEQDKQIKAEKNQIIKSISHELITPITTIINYLHILKDKKCESKEEEQEHLISAYDMSMKLKRLISELLEFTKLSNKTIEAKLIEMDLGFLIIKMLEEHTPRLTETGLQIRLDIREEILVKINPEKITKAFNNILSNIEKYGNLLSQLIIKVENKADTVHISISNKSKDLECPKLNTMFENLNKIDISKSENFEESELSLAISKKVIELHHGQIWFEVHKNINKIHIELPINYKNKNII